MNKLFLSLFAVLLLSLSGCANYRCAAPNHVCVGKAPPVVSDIRLKHDIVLLGHLDNGLGFYRFSYNGSDKVYVGVMAQEVQQVVPEAVARDKNGYLSVYYDRLGVPFQTWDEWVASGEHVPHTADGSSY